MRLSEKSMVRQVSQRLIFLCSGGGGNLRFVHMAIMNKLAPGIEISAVIADRPCAALDFARSQAIAARVADFSHAGQLRLMDELAALEPDMIISTVHKILIKEIVGKFRGRIINLHYSLLPAFGGAIGVKPVEAALSYGAKLTGVTAHLVSEGVDSGKPLVQSAVAVEAGDSSAALMNILFRCGCLALLAAILLQLGRTSAAPAAAIPVLGRKCLFSGGDTAALALAVDENQWRRIAQPAQET
jgi:phosphoribosylglycinamide formyltransferase 1